MASRWHILRTDAALTLCRQLPPRLDIAAQTTLPLADPLRIAHQVRQDMWRAFQRVRGFSPVVRVTWDLHAMTVQAGGRIGGPVAEVFADRLLALLEDPAHRRRWLRHARLNRSGQVSGSGGADFSQFDMRCGFAS